VGKKTDPSWIAGSKALAWRSKFASKLTILLSA